MDRRQLLKSALYTAPLFTAGRLYATPASGPRLLVVFLRGAYDATAIVAPTGSDFYHSVRPTIGPPWKHSGSWSVKAIGAPLPNAAASRPMKPER